MRKPRLLRHLSLAPLAVACIFPVFGLVLIAPAAHANVQGTILFAGIIRTDTCKVSSDASAIGSAGPVNMKVTMTERTLSDLQSVQARTATTPETKVPINFHIKECNVDQVRVNFSPSSEIDTNTGYLRTNKAGLQIRIFNSRNEVIHLQSNQNNDYSLLTGNEATLTYYADYHLLEAQASALKAGAVTATATFFLDYM